jgi:hypothetical protein
VIVQFVQADFEFNLEAACAMLLRNRFSQKQVLCVQSFVMQTVVRRRSM